MSYTYYFGTPAFCISLSNQLFNEILFENEAPFVFALSDINSKKEVVEFVKKFSNKENAGLMYGVTLTDPDNEIFYTERSIFVTSILNLKDIFKRYPKLKEFTLVEFKRDREYTASVTIKPMKR